MSMKPKIETYYRNDIVRPLGYHEAGHYVAARELGFKTGSLKLKMLDLYGAHSGGSVLQPVCALYNLDDVLKHLEARVQVLYAGALAQSLSNGKIQEKGAVSVLDEGGGKNDFAKARELMHLIRNIRFPSATDETDVQRGLDEINSDLWNKAVALVEKDHKLICGLGNRLASELKYIGQEFELCEAELETLRSIQERFPKSEERKT